MSTSDALPVLWRCLASLNYLGRCSLQRAGYRNPEIFERLHYDIDLDGTVHHVAGSEHIYTAFKRMLRARVALIDLIDYATPESLPGSMANPVACLPTDYPMEDASGLCLYMDDITEEFDNAFPDSPLDEKGRELISAVKKKFRNIGSALDFWMVSERRLDK